MPKEHHKLEEIVAKLRQVDVLTSSDLRQAGLRLTGGFGSPEIEFKRRSFGVASVDFGW
jgi:hypothetical protein